MTSGLEEFKGVLSEYAKLSVWAVGGSVVTPFIASFLSIIPPWPSGLNVITSVIQLVTLAISYQGASQNKREVGRAMRWLAFAGFIGLLIYMGAFTMFTIYVPPVRRSIVIGYECLEDARKIFGSRCPFLTLDDLSAAAFDEFLIWTRPSITFVRVLLVGLWLALFICLALLLGQFLAFQMRRRVKVVT
jgi:hypothetical protein